MEFVTARRPCAGPRLALISLLLAAFAATSSFPGAAFAQDPGRPVRIVVPVASGTNDLFARLLAPKLSEALGQPVIVENKGGAGGNIGVDLVAKAPPDGNTLLVGFTAIAVNVTLFDKLPFDLRRDLAPITLAAATPQYLVVHPGLGLSSVAELVAYAKARPGAVNYGSISIGSASHLTMEMFKAAAAIDLVHVPYKGSVAAMNDLMAGNVQAAFFVASNVLPLAKSGRMRMLASTGRTRVRATPGIPTLIESGYPDFEAIAWVGILTRAGTPMPVIERYHRELVRILRLPDVADRLGSLELEVIASNPEEFARFIDSEIGRWGAVVKRTGARAD